MHFARQLLLYIGIISLALLVFGLFKPWMMLWWEDVQNRKKVIRLYGSIFIVCYSLYRILHFVE